MKPQIDITLASPFTLRDLRDFVDDAEHNGIDRDSGVAIAYPSTGGVDATVLMVRTKEPG